MQTGPDDKTKPAPIDEKTLTQVTGGTKSGGADTVTGGAESDTGTTGGFKPTAIM
jgi:hypothetical protein